MFLVAYEKRAKKSLSQRPQGRLTLRISTSFALAKDKLPHYTTPPLPSGSGLSNFSQGMPQVISVCFYTATQTTFFLCRLCVRVCSY